jgi:hypothetical protein
MIRIQYEQPYKHTSNTKYQKIGQHGLSLLMSTGVQETLYVIPKV